MRFLNRNPPSLVCDGRAEPKIVRLSFFGCSHPWKCIIICMMWWFAGFVWESARFACARFHGGMWLLDLEIGVMYSVCSLLGLFVDAALYLLLSRKWCPPWEDGADADPMLMAMTEAFAGELIGDADSMMFALVVAGRYCDERCCAVGLFV